MNFLQYRSFPSFYKDYAPKLLEFFGAWLDWLSEKDNSSYIIDHLSSEHDIDESITAFNNQIKKKLISDFPETISSDLKLLLKNIFYLYNSKSSIDSYEFLFRCLFDSPCSITYPKDFILKTSDGRWIIPKFIQTEGFDILSNIHKYNWWKLEGKETHSICYIDGADIFKNDNGEYENCLRVSSVSGNFKKGEELILTNPETGFVESSDRLKVKFYLEDLKNGRWNGSKGTLDSDMKIQDSYYYQDFSYIISSNVPISKWKPLIKSIINPAGLEVFGGLMSSGNDGKGGTSPKLLVMNPLAFLSQWKLVFKLYILESKIKLNFNKRKLTTLMYAQNHSETYDKWMLDKIYTIYDGFEHIDPYYAETFLNKNSVIMFRDDGTLINPELINWYDFSFYDKINTKYLTSITLHPDYKMLLGKINGNVWKSTENNFPKNNFMMFTTITNPINSSLIKNMILDDSYYAYENRYSDNIIIKNIQDTTLDIYAVTPLDNADKFNGYTKVRLGKIDPKVNVLYENDKSKQLKYFHTKDSIYTDTLKFLLNDIGKLNVLDTIYGQPRRRSWYDLTQNDFVNTNEKSHKFYNHNSFLKIPENIITQKEDYYIVDGIHFSDEKILIVSYSNDDVEKILFYENKDKLEKYTFEVDHLVEQDDILCFIDGILSNEYDIDNNKIIVNCKEHSFVEIYILSKIEYRRKQKELYNENFIYNNARVWKYMPYFNDIKKLSISDKLHDNYVNRHPNWCINWNVLLKNQLENENFYHLKNISFAQNQSETADMWLSNNFYDKQSYFSIVLDQINATTNKSSVMVFHNNGNLINPSNINKYFKKILIEDFLKNKLGDSIVNDDVYTTSTNKNILSQISSNDYILKEFNDTFIKEKLGDFYINDEIYLFDKKNTDINDNKIISLPILSNNKVIEVKIKNTNVIKLNEEDFIENNVFIFINNKKLLEKSFKIDKVNYQYILNENYTGDVVIYNYNKDYINKYYFYNDVKNISLRYNKDYIIIFSNGKYINDWDYKDNKIIFKEFKYDIEVFLLNEYDYYLKDISNFDGHNNFIFNNLRKMNFMPSWNSLINFIELNDNLNLESLKDNSINIFNILRKKCEIYSKEFIINSFKMYDMQKQYVLNNENIINYIDINTSKLEFDTNNKAVITYYHEISQKIKNIMLYFNISDDNITQAIQMYKTMDRAIYDGDINLSGFENKKVSFIEKETNEYNTMLFNDKGLVVYPNDIDWSNTEFNTLNNKKYNLLESKYFIPVILNSNYPAIVSSIKKGEFKKLILGKQHVNNDIYSNIDNTKLGTIKITDDVLYNINDESKKKFGKFNIKDTIYYFDINKFNILKNTTVKDNIYINDDNYDSIGNITSNIDIKTYEKGITKFKNLYVNDKLYMYTDINHVNHTFKPNIDEVFISNQMIFINGRKVYKENVDFIDNIYYFKNIDDYFNKELNYDDIVIYQYNNDDIEKIITSIDTNNRFYKTGINNITQYSILLFIDGYRSDDYYISNDTIILNNKFKNNIEIYIFKQYDYLYMIKENHGKTRYFSLNNIKKIKYV